MPLPSPSARPALVLIANDQEWTARSLESMLSPNGFAVLCAFTGQQCIELARTTRPDAILVDLRLPDMDGHDVLRALDQLTGDAPVPCIALTSNAISRSERHAAMEAGAWAVYTQPIDGELLLTQLRTFVRAGRCADALAEASLLDAESGLYNARGMARRARELGAEAQRRREPLACIAFTPDLSAAAEPTRLSPAQVEATVRRLIDLVSRSGRLSDVIGRLGQTEFAVLLPATEAQGALRLIERLQASLVADAEREGLAPPPQLRAGYASVPDVASASFDAVELLLRASAAMRRGRDSKPGQRVMAFEEQMRAQLPH